MGVSLVVMNQSLGKTAMIKSMVKSLVKLLPALQGL